MMLGNVLGSVAPQCAIAEPCHESVSHWPSPALANSVATGHTQSMRKVQAGPGW
jgi:hypothetical protein